MAKTERLTMMTSTAGHFVSIPLLAAPQKLLIGNLEAAIPV